MKILAIDSSGLVATVAVMEEDNMVAEYTIHYKKTHSQTLLPMIDDVAKMIDLDLSTVDAFAISKGPGSFTGLRIGSATVKGLAQAMKKPIVEVSTLEALAYNLYGFSGIICPIMDARRGQVYTGIYEFAGNPEHKEKSSDLLVLKEETAIAMEELINEINLIGKPITFLGDGVPVFKDLIKDQVKVAASFAPAQLKLQRASSVAMLAFVKLNNEETVEPFEHKPEYLRLSQAERERLEKEKEISSAN